MCKKVSVIIPLYHGKIYIPNLLAMLSRNRESFDGDVEVIFVNDDGEQINLSNDIPDNLSVQLLQNPTNMGIHGSRIKGLLAAKGEYVLFLDQDDIISDRYLASQVAAIQDADMVVSDGICMGRPIYGDVYSHEQLLNIDIFKKIGNIIVSPGHVLIKKNSIPTEWINDVCSYNGADDYYLWLLMLSKGRKIRINRQKLYLHTHTGNNTSLNCEEMIKSLGEIREKLIRYDIMDEDESVEWIELATAYLKAKEVKYISLYRVFNAMLWQSYNNCFVNSVLKEMDLSGIAIYGFGVIARHILFQQQIEDSVSVKYIIDHKAYCFRNMGKLSFIEPGEEMEGVDAIIISIVQDGNSIKKKLESIYNCIIITIEDLVYNCCGRKLIDY